MASDLFFPSNTESLVLTSFFLFLQDDTERVVSSGIRRHALPHVHVHIGSFSTSLLRNMLFLKHSCKMG